MGNEGKGNKEAGEGGRCHFVFLPYHVYVTLAIDCFLGCPKASVAAAQEWQAGLVSFLMLRVLA